ncbi:ribosome biogenesis GTPase YlqF [Jeotgalibaca ciconiae]|uniref:Ribosome biogenesis GTPase A n=1 Tax=Jeotgalibaca ciconiae TaxID=2496265 RepID=A0A3Q9BN71_9LACT|nr:ribosome biogenesis GTPase YlqF [Jeotgalibaca ciconiae]AZP05368.1 ribosome biogenesis GTPase YlqF [Jeotgalibaca ciconiae]HJB22578.1 ribosome biogenesis GTPase YlqF [Candidatus Jeotgalibaca pullicola]
MVIQWFPGHMAKAKREAIENRKMVDIVIELVDARIPESSSNPLMDEIVGNKPRLIILNKADLADRNKTEKWLQYYNRNTENQKAIAINVFNQTDINYTKKVLQGMMSDKAAKWKEKGMKPRATRLMVLGIPNVGKSTFINQMIRKNRAKTANKPGVTKQQQWLKISNEFELLDTPGILWHKFEDPQTGIHLALTGAIKDTLFHKDDIALYALKFFLSNYPGRLQSYYHLNEDISEENLPDLLMELTKKLNFGDDYDRASEKLIFDIRDGKLGTFTLDEIPHTPVSDEKEFN